MMVGMILLYWAIPFVLLLALVGHIMADRQEKTGLERVWQRSFRWTIRTV